MKKITMRFRIKAIVLFFLGFSITSSSQIDIADTTALVIAHWNLNETQSYKVSFKATSKEEDRIISSKVSNYDLFIKVIDSTQVAYILEWTRTNIDGEGENELDSALNKITEGISFWILTDEFGSSVQVLNWEDIGEEINKRSQVLLERYRGIPENIKKINRFIRRASTKVLFETNMILDVQQLLAFHGAKYKFDERIDYKVKVPNNFGGDPLDANSTLIMDQVNFSQGTFIIRSSQRINPHQLTAVTYDYLSSLNMVDAVLPPYEEFPLVTKLIWGGSEIHGKSGWVIFSEESKQTTHEKIVTIEERTIELLKDSNK